MPTSLRDGEDAEPESVPRVQHARSSLASGTHPELPKDGREVALDSGFLDVKLAGDLAVREPEHDQAEHLLLARGQGRRPGLTRLAWECHEPCASCGKCRGEQGLELCLRHDAVGTGIEQPIPTARVVVGCDGDDPRVWLFVA